jgi:hypothetical protein
MIITFSLIYSPDHFLLVLKKIAQILPLWRAAYTQNRSFSGRIFVDVEAAGVVNRLWRPNGWSVGLNNGSRSRLIKPVD